MKPRSSMSEAGTNYQISSSRTGKKTIPLPIPSLINSIKSTSKDIMLWLEPIQFLTLSPCIKSSKKNSKRKNSHSNLQKSKSSDSHLPNRTNDKASPNIWALKAKRSTIADGDKRCTHLQPTKYPRPKRHKNGWSTIRKCRKREGWFGKKKKKNKNNAYQSRRILQSSWARSCANRTGRCRTLRFRRLRNWTSTSRQCNSCRKSRRDNCHKCMQGCFNGLSYLKQAQGRSRTKSLWKRVKTRRNWVRRGW